MKLLIVDDIEDYLSSLTNVLKDEYEIITARSLEEAKEHAKGGIDIALIDIRLSEEDMSNRDGLVFLEWLKMNYPQIPAIVMSAYQEFDLAVDALNLGAKYFLKKPINLKELRGVLKTSGGERNNEGA
ncbi:MAG TPA: response regulator [bacterium (Candidatus Stahlbacteria)]|nr:response regulator [Candidatus Stahlbacteria bacterium]